MDKHGHFATYSNPVIAGQVLPDVDEGDQSGRGDGDCPSRPRARSRGEGAGAGGRPSGQARDGTEARRTDASAAVTNGMLKHGAEFDVVTLAPGEDRMVLAHPRGAKARQDHSTSSQETTRTAR